MIVRILSTLAVLAGLAACSSSGEEPAEPDRPALSGPESRDVLVHGRVLDAGKPVEDAAVTIEIWPDSDDHEYDVGETVDMFDVTTSTDAEGRYVVVVDPRRLESRYFGGHDFVNFDVRVESGGDMTSWSTTTHLVGADGIWRSEPEARVGDRVLELAFDLSEETVDTTTSTGETTREDLPVLKVDVAS